MRVIKVQGKGRIAASPDMVTLSFGVQAKAKNYAACLDLLNCNTEALRASITAAGCDRSRLKTGEYEITTDTQYKDGKHIHLGYCASHQLHIELPMDKELLDRTLQQVAKSQSGARIHLSFSVGDTDGMRRRVLAAAVRAAQANATVLADAAGITLGALQQIDYGWQEIRVQGYETELLCVRSEAQATATADIEPDEVSAEDTVTLVYAISD
ncbi:MAG TPA: SIMPL domain-containing protein [bacterium]|mgnify:CR=1 FL=1|nr:SIMPL domain-containing protein [bacterium]